jgi:tetratricopeptide (TPR) repeat protein
MTRSRNTPVVGGKKLGPSSYFIVLALSPFVALSLWCQVTSTGQAEIQAHKQKAQDSLKSGNRDAAEDEFRAILALDPNNIDARGNLGVMRFFHGDWAGAAQQFRRVLKVQPSFWKAQALLGICEKRLGHPGEAQRLLEGSVPHLNDGALRIQAGLELVEIRYSSGDLDKAAEIVGTLQRTNPASADVLYTAYRIHSDLANRARDALASVAPDSSRMHQIMAQHLINEADVPGAIKQYRAALAIDPELRGVHYELGEAILKDSTSDTALQQAEEQFRAALAENPGDAGAEYGLGRVSAQRLDFKSAIEHYSRALALRRDYTYAEIALGEALMKTDKSQQALEHLLAASRLDPLNPTVHYRLASLYRELGREDDAHRELAAFKKLREWNKRIERVYQEMHQLVPEGDAIPPDAPRE